MEGHYLYGLASFYIALFVVAVVFCVVANDDDDFIKGVFLGVLFFANQSDSFWLNPEAMFIYHMATLLVMLPAMSNVRHWKAILITTYVLFISDVIWVYMPELHLTENAWAFPYDIFYWQSILNIVLAILCIVVMKGCYNTRQIRKLKKRIAELRRRNDNIIPAKNPGAVDYGVGIEARPA